MIICICNAIRDKQLDSALEGGASSVCEAFQKIGCQPMCGRCVPEMQELIQTRRAVCITK